MPKTIRNQFDKKLNFTSLIEAHYRAVDGKRNKVEVLLFEQDLETNISNLLYQLQSGTYKLGKYREFKIFEPKERIIKSLPYKDRIIHQWYVYNFIIPYFVPRFIEDNYACIPGRGTHSCMLKTQCYMCKMKEKYDSYYVIKGDIKKYFYNINKNILYRLLSSHIKDKKLLNLTKILIYDSDEICSIPIGNYTSQYFANIYLDQLDHFIKDKLKIKYYTRFMDDFCVLLPSKEEAKIVLDKIRIFLAENLALELNPKTRYYPSKFGINFCGYIIHEKYVLLRKNCKIKMKREKKKGILILKNHKGHLKFANCYYFIQDLLKM